MTLRPLLSDELLQAYFPRLQWENLVDDNASLAVRLQLGGSGTYRRLSRLPDVLVATAEALGVEVRSLLCQHSLVPFLKCVEPDSVCGSDRDFRDRCYIWHAFRTVVYPRMCTECVKEDRAILGWSYWHRMHQIPGVYWCLKHRCPLSVAMRAVPFSRAPHHILQMGEAYPIRSDEEVDNPVLGRYASLVSALLDGLVAPIRRSVLAELVRSRCEILGLSTCKGRHRLLSEFAKECVPEQWMAVTFRESQRTSSNNLASWVDRVGQARTRPASPILSVLAMALLWEDPDEAALVLFAVHAANRTVREVKPLGSQLAAEQTKSAADLYCG
jgi:hypothetical protein